MSSNGKKISQRKLPETGDCLVRYFEEHGAPLAAGTFRDFSEYSLVSNGELDIRSAREIWLDNDILSDMFRSVRTYDGKEVYTGARLEKADPGELVRVQNFVFMDVLKEIREKVHNKYRFPILYYDEAKKAMTIYMPPVVEIHGGEKVLIDGIHRSVASMENGKELYVIIADTVDGAVLPASPLSKIKEIPTDFWLEEYMPTGRKFRGIPKYENLDPNLFRMYNYAGFGKFHRRKRSGENK